MKLMQANVPSWQRILRQFLPTKAEILLLVVANGVLLLAVLYSLIAVRSDHVSEFQSFTKVMVLGPIFSRVRELIGIVVTANVATLILWGVIGSFVYSFISGMQALLSGAANTFVEIFLYVHPKGYSRTEYVLQVAVERVISIIIFVIMILYIWAFCSTIVPFVFVSAKDSIMPLGISSFLAAGSFVFFSIALHGLVVLIRLENGDRKSVV